jgi:predicted  nucleic acid-binding Zn-ribbon protein
VALNCIRCGKALPRDDARFCSNCGAPVVRRQASAQPSSPQDPATPPPAAQSQPERKKPALREQVAQQPLARSTQRGQDGASAKKTSEIAEGEQRDQASVAWPAPLTHITAADPSTHRPEAPDETAQKDFPSPEQKARVEAPARALNVKVWEPEGQPESESAEATDIEDLPTREVTVAPTEQFAAKKDAFEKPPDTPPLAAPPQLPESSPGAPVHTGDQSQRDDVAQRDTLLLNAQGKPSSPAFQKLPHTPVPASRLAALPLPPAGGRRALWLIVAGLLCILVLGGVGAWIVRTQPFSVPAITQPQQSFQDKQLGLALLYPSGWTVQVDRGKSTVHFSDSSHTAAVDIMVAPAGNNDLTHYLQQQATQRGMTGAKLGAPLSFAGASWQQIRGNVLQRGANYIETIFATVHNDHLVVLTQLAHQSIYAAEEKMSFSPLRASLRFV